MKTQAASLKQQAASFKPQAGPNPQAQRVTSNKLQAPILKAQAASRKQQAARLVVLHKVSRR